jgi:intracellular sulfur oxidation DsrE/DsrF family protein
MKIYYNSSKYFISLLAASFAFLTLAAPILANEYKALENVKQVKVVFDVSLGSPKMGNLVFWAVKNVYEDKNVQMLSQPPEAVVVFHGPAVKLITSDLKGLSDSEKEEAKTFVQTLKKMKQDGVKLEVCLYAVKVMGIDPATILPEIDKVGNGFISIAGYQQQGYSLITIN